MSSRDMMDVLFSPVLVSCTSYVSLLGVLVVMNIA